MESQLDVVSVICQPSTRVSMELDAGFNCEVIAEPIFELEFLRKLACLREPPRPGFDLLLAPVGQKPVAAQGEVPMVSLRGLARHEETSCRNGAHERHTKR